MLGKLLKYEIPAMGRKLLPLYAAWAVTAILLGVTLQTSDTKNELIVVLSVLLYVAVTTAIFVMAVILIIQRYSRSLLGDEAYFNHVLPVSASAHIGNKLISATAWVLITMFVALLTALLIWLSAMIVSGFDFTIFNADPGELYIPKNLGLYAVEILILIAASTVKTVMQIYAALTIGHQASNHTTLASIGAYILVLMFEGAVGRALAPVLFKIEYDSDNLVNITNVFVPAFLMTAAFTAVYFFVCKYLMEKRLNLA